MKLGSLGSIRKLPLRPFYASRSAVLAKWLERERAVIFLSCAVLAFLALAEGVSALLGGPRLVVAWVAALVVTAAYGLYHLRQVRSAIRQLERDTAEERTARARLSGAAVAGARVFFDVPCGREGVPAVILSQHGAYAVQVWSAISPSTTAVKVAIDESRFRFGGVSITPNPLRLASDCVQPLQQILRIGRTDDIVVRPLVVVAGAAIEVERSSAAPDVTVVSADALDEFIKSQPEELSVMELTMHAVRLAAHVKQVGAGSAGIH